MAQVPSVVKGSQGRGFALFSQGVKETRVRSVVEGSHGREFVVTIWTLHYWIQRATKRLGWTD